MVPGSSVHECVCVCVLLIVVPGEGAQVVCGEPWAWALFRGLRRLNVACMSILGDPGRRAADTTSVIP